VPKYEGLDLYGEKILHSHDYRQAEDFADQRVLIVGGSFSALDIMLQIASHAAKVRFFYFLKFC